MKPTDVLTHYKTQQLAASALGIAQASIAKWLKNGVVPELRQLQLEALTGGALKADAGILPRRTTKNSYENAKNKQRKADRLPSVGAHE